MADPISAVLAYIPPQALSLMRPREVAELVWMLSRMAPDEGGAAAPSAAGPPPEGVPAGGEPVGPEPEADLAAAATLRVERDEGGGEAGGPPGPEARGDLGAGDESVGVEIAGRGGTDAGPGTLAGGARRAGYQRVPFDVAQSLPGVLPYSRALHRMARSRPNWSAPRIDVPATVQHSAAAMSLVVTLTPTLVPSTQVIWLIDTAVQLSPWQASLDHVFRLQRSLSSFAEITAIDLDLRGAVAETYERGSGVRMPAGEGLKPWLRPGADTLVLLVTDGLSDGVRSGMLSQYLRNLPASARVAWVHPWPESRWWRSGLTKLSGAHAHRPGGIVVPVVPFSAAGLNRLQHFALGRTAHGLSLFALPEARPMPMRAEVRIAPSPTEFVRRLFPVLEPATVRLVCLAACIPGHLDLPLLLALAANLVPGANRYNAAEAICSGLVELVRVDGGAVVRVVDRYRPVLLGFVTAGELRQVYSFIEARYLHSSAPDRATIDAERLRIPIHLVQRSLAFTAEDEVPDLVVQHECSMEGAGILARTLTAANTEFSLQTLARAVPLARKGTLGPSPFVPGSWWDAEVVNVMSYGVFMRLEGGAGLLYRRQITPGVVPTPGCLLQPGDRVRVRIVEADQGADRLSLAYELSVEQRSLLDRYRVGSSVLVVVGAEDTALGRMGVVDDQPAILQGFLDGNGRPPDAGTHLPGVVVGLRLESNNLVVAPYGAWGRGLTWAVIEGTGTGHDTLRLDDGGTAKLPRKERCWPAQVGDWILVAISVAAEGGEFQASERMASTMVAADERGIRVGTRVRCAVRGPIEAGWLVSLHDVRGLIPHSLWTLEEQPIEVDAVVVWVDVPRQRYVLALGDSVPSLGDAATPPAQGEAVTATVLGTSEWGVHVVAEGWIGLVPPEFASLQTPRPAERDFPAGSHVSGFVRELLPQQGTLTVDLIRGLEDPWAGADHQAGDVVRGVVERIDDNAVVVRVGPLRAQLRAKHVADLTLVRLEDRFRVSDPIRCEVVTFDRAHRRFWIRELADPGGDLNEAFAELLAKKEANISVTGTIEGIVLRGYRVSLEGGLAGVAVFSDLDSLGVRDRTAWIGERLEFDIVAAGGPKQISISNSLFRARAAEARIAWLKANLRKDLEVEGKVKRLQPYGAFIDLGGVDGLLHISDMSYGKIQHPKELLEVGARILVKVLKYDEGSGRVSLGYKQMRPDPWEDAERKYGVGTTVRGCVSSVPDYGAFVELDEGIEGLVHIREMTWNKRIKLPGKLVNIGDIVEAKVLGIDRENRRISLSMRQLQTNPWEAVAARYSPGTVVRGKVRNITDFGIFIGIEDGIDGLVHISDMSWGQRVLHPSERYQKGDEVEARVLNVDVEKERFGLGVKQLRDDPWMSVAERYLVGQVVLGKMVHRVDFGIFVELEDGVEGLVHHSELATGGSDWQTAYVEGASITAEILSINVSERKVSLSEKSTQKLDGGVNGPIEPGRSDKPHE